MTGHRRTRALAVGAGVAAAVVLGPVSTAVAHTHPTPTELTEPAVVYVEARAHVEVALVEHKQLGDPFGVHIGIIPSVWDPVLAAASGFVVDPTGAVVTTGAVSAGDLSRAQVYAVNEAFHQRYGSAAPLPADPFSQHHIGPPSDTAEQRLQACYTPQSTNDAGGCVVHATWDYRVYPYVTSQQRYGNLPANVIGHTADVTVLRVTGATSMPTVDLARSAAGAHALAALGFTGVPGPGQPLLTTNTHLATVGGSVLKTTGFTGTEAADAVKLDGEVAAGVQGGPVVAEMGQVIGFLVPPAAGATTGSPSATASSTATPTGAPSGAATGTATGTPSGSSSPAGGLSRLVGAAAIATALSRANVTPQRGPVDISFENAMHAFKNHGYAGSISGFRNTLALFPGHVPARTDLAQAVKLAGSPAAQTAQTGQAGQTVVQSSSGISPWLVVGLVLLGLVLIGLLLALFLRRRRKPATGEPGPPVRPPREPVPAGAAPATAPAATAATAAGQPRGSQPPGAPGGPGPAPRTGPGGPPPGPSGAPGAVAAGAAGAAAAGASHAGSRPLGPSPAQPGATRNPASAGPTAGGGRPPGAAAGGPAGAPAGAGAGAAPRASVGGRPGGSAVRPAPGQGPVRSGPLAGAAQAGPGSESGSTRARNFCTTCGGRLAAGDRFCGWCGEPVT